MTIVQDSEDIAHWTKKVVAWLELGALELKRLGEKQNKLWRHWRDYTNKCELNEVKIGTQIDGTESGIRLTPKERLLDPEKNTHWREALTSRERLYESKRSSGKIASAMLEQKQKPSNATNVLYECSGLYQANPHTDTAVPRG